MNLYLSDEQRMLRESMAKLFSTESTSERLRAAETEGIDAALWRRVVAAGIAMLRVPQQAGGLESSLLDALLVAEEAGRYIAAAPIVEILVATRLLGLASTDNTAAQEWLERVFDGAIISLALHDVQVCPQQVVPAGLIADAVLILNGEQLILCSGFAARQRQANLGSDAIAQLTLPQDAGERMVLCEGNRAAELFQAAIEEWKLLTAARLAGLSRQGLQMAADYSKERFAFGSPIGSFQGISHPLADAITETEGAQLLTWRAAWAIAKGRVDAAASVSMAYWWAAQMASKSMTRALRTFGGYGVSLEYDIQMYYRKSKSAVLPLGDPQQELHQIGQRLWHGVSVALPNAGQIDLDFSLGERAEAFGAEVAAYFETNMTPELRAHAHHSVAGFHPAFNKQLARDGLLFPHWPKQYGGQERDAYDLAAMTAVLEANGWEHVTAPITNQVAQILMLFACDEVKEEVLTRFGSGESLACMGFTEPSCGCDVFAAKTKAEKQKDGRWLINGQKIFTTAANLADYCFLLARTNPDKPKHAGLSVFLVPMQSPGIEVHAVHTLQDERTNIVYFSDVYLEDKYLIGPLDGGLKVMASTLEMEHGAADQYRHGHVSMVHATEQWALNAKRLGQPLLNDRDACDRLARAKTHLEVSTVLCRRAIWALQEKIHSRYWGPMAKYFACEMYQTDALDLMDLTAPDSIFASNQGLGHVELGYRQSIGTTIYGGTSEVQRSLVAEQALAMPKSR
ncbi:acyl-CoA dehydrogenase [Halioxenophilus aromaticivorans]|uniref:Acyl-CoA dehydrogenase n=1 Tax=Halioxenophilus aromaticivorans TaxID=1306992 RepID=A0AAV3U6P0_9ALTE